MKKSLLIVESPTKAKTITRFVGKDFVVESSFGHIRDLPKSTMGIDIEHQFEPTYVIAKDKEKIVSALKKKAKSAEDVYFATDEDREGEAISWHLSQILDIPHAQAKRITFHEITNKAILEALTHPRPIDIHLVNAQQARRILDRLVGYKLSPFLWKKVAKGLSAGRVQSVALRYIIEREREIQNFKSEEFWTIEADFISTGSNQGRFSAQLAEALDRRLEKFSIKNQDEADTLVRGIHSCEGFVVAALQTREKKKTPPPPFITSTLQQQANNRLGFSAKQTMRLAQELYEGIDIGEEGATGLITYMRTDSLHLSDEFVSETRTFIEQSFGMEFALATPRRYKKKSKLAQEAHEAIRPTSIGRRPEDVKNFLHPKQYKLYTLIWQRACASQMKEALLEQTTIHVQSTDKHYTFKATGSVLRFPGYLSVYPSDMKENLLPSLKVPEPVNLSELRPEQHFTQPPPRYTEASLIKTLEENGIGRPSTYAPTISTIEQRNYVNKVERNLVPTDIAFLVNDVLVEHFPEIVDYDFTAKMEDDLDNIASGKYEWQPIIQDFYTPFKTRLEQKDQELNKKELTETATDQVCEKCGSHMIIKIGRFGKFLACSQYPLCRNTKNIVNGTVEETPEKPDQACPECGKPLTHKRSRFGAFIGCSGYPDCKYVQSASPSLGIACPECGKGEIAMKKSRRGKVFYACNAYPACKFALWDKPTGETCPQCGSLLVEKKDEVQCASKTCHYKKE